MAARKFKFVSPGVFLKEIDNSQLPKLPGGIGPVIIGRTRKGPALKPLKVSSFQDFVRIFGSTVPGNQGTDPWREGNGLLATAYAPYAAQAYLNANIQSPITMIRLAGVAGDDAVGDEASPTGVKHPGWHAETAFGIFATPKQAADGQHAAAATATIQVTGVYGSDGFMVNGSNIVLTDSEGTTMTITLDNSTNTSAAGKIGGDSAGSTTVFAQRIAQAINATAGKITASPTNGSSATITLSQDVGGTAGNTSITTSNTNADIVITHFTGGGPSTMEAGLVGIIYATDANIQVGLKGSGHRWNGITGSVDPSAIGAGTYDEHLSSSTGSACGHVIEPNDDGTHSIIINLHNGSNAMSSGLERKVSFSEGSNYIRDVLNTNPVKTNTTISQEVSGTLAHKYWLGETFEEEYNRVKSTLSGSTQGVCLFTLPIGGIGTHTALEDFKSPKHQASPGKTGWVFDQHVGPNGSFEAKNQQKLFRVVSLHEGESPSKDMIIGIENIRIPEVGAVNPYSTFAVVVKRVTGTRVEEIERFDGCNLNPNSQNFIARKIGNQYFTWSSVEKRNKVYGSYPNVSDHIRIVVEPDVLENGPLNPSAAPFGFFGPIVPEDINSDALGADGKGTFNEWAKGDLTFGTITTAVKLKFPTFPIIRSGSLRDTMFGVSPFKQSYVSGSLSSKGSVLNPGYVDFCRRMPAYRSLLTDHDTGFDTDAKSKYSFIFTMDDIYVTGTTALDNDLSDFTATTIAHEPGSRKAGTSATAQPDTTPTILMKEVFDSFQMPIVGGFEGVDITEADPFNMRVVDSSATTATNYAYASIDRAIELIRDPESLEMNLAAMPGITNESLTTKLVETCESRADALAVIDLPDVYVPPFQEKCDKFEERLTSTPAKAARALTARQLNSSYGCTYYPWVKVRDSIYTRDVWVPPSVVALGVMAYTEQRNEVWFAPAGFNRGGLNEGNAGLAVLQVTEQLLSKHRDTLYEANINPIASFVTEGLVVFGQKTLQSTQSALDRINVRRLLIFVKKEVSRISNGLLFDQNLPATWNRFKSQVIPMLESVKTRLGLSDFRVILDETTTTPDLVDRNIMYAKIFLKPARAIEFIAVDFVITNTGASFDD